MSSARNHAKRSHGSEHAKRAAIGASARKMLISQPAKTKRVALFEKIAKLFHRNKEA